MLANNTPMRLVVDGEEYLVHPLTLGEIESLQEWVDAQHRDPIGTVLPHLGKGLTMAAEQFMLGKAIEIASRPRARIGSVEASDLLQTSEGVKETLRVAIAKGRPGFSRADMDALWARLSPAHLAAAKATTGVDAVLHDPN